MNTRSPLCRCIATLIVAVATSMISTSARAEDGKIRLSLFGGDRIVGSGKLASESRAVTGFEAVALRGKMKLVLRQGAREGIELRADDNLLPLVEAIVVDRGGVPTLELVFKKAADFSTRNPVVATIDLITLKALSISGSGDIVGDALRTPRLAVAITGSGNVRLKQLVADEVSAMVSGSGDIEFTGRTAKLGMSISGSGDVNTLGLAADDVSVSIAGSGDADVMARKTLTVSIAGVGNVNYTGDAVVKSQIAGSGRVTRR